MDILRPIDYVWSVEESHHQRGKGPRDGASLLMWGWYLDAMLPLWSFARQLDAGRAVDGVILAMLLATPFVFCRLRYTPRRREAILARFRNKHPGRSLLFVWIGMVAIACVETLLMLHLGIWRVGMER